MIGFAAQFLRKAAAAIARVLHATWQGCRMHFARARWPAGPPCRVSLYCPKLPKLAALLTEVETGVLAYMSFYELPLPALGRAAFHQYASNGSTARSVSLPGNRQLTDPAHAGRTWWQHSATPLHHARGHDLSVSVNIAPKCWNTEYVPSSFKVLLIV